MAVAAYYNEIDPYAAQWLRNLIEAGHIATGVVDERSIEDVKPDELMGYTQCHFFAGIGVWSLALRRAGWPDNRPVWTGSCPCQPFSAAGSGAGFADPRHLWPSFAWLIKQCAPPVVIGEQVASKAVEPWLDLVQTDLEAMGYAFGAIPFPSAGIGAPHIRDRLYWVADASRAGLEGRNTRTLGDECAPAKRGCGTVGLANTKGIGERADESGPDSRESIELAGTESGSNRSHDGADAGKESERGQVNGLWRDADWLFCRDGKWRPVESGTFPLANGAPSRVGRLRAYGNAINAQAAKEFIAAYMDTLKC